MDNRDLFYGPGYNSPFDNVIVYVNKRVGAVQGMIDTIGSGGAAPTTANINPGKSSIWYNTTTSSLGVYANYNGTIVSVSGGGGGGVATFNGRSGTVVPTTGDYTFAQIGSTPTTLSGYGITNGQTTITLTTTGSGAATFSGGTLNIPTPGTPYITSLTTTGTSGAATVTSGVLNIPQYTVVTGANPTASSGLTVVNGTATTFMRSDGAPALSQAITPLWTAVHNFNPGTVGVTYTDAVQLYNTALATSSVPQDGPSAHFQSQGWSTGSAISMNADWWIRQEVTSGSVVPTNNLGFWGSQNGGTKTETLLLTQGQGISVIGSITASVNFLAGAAGGYTWGGAGTAAGLYSDSTYEMSVRQSTHACQVQVYNTYTSSSVFEAGVFGFQTNANALSIGTITTGGTLRQTQFVGGTINMIATAVKRTAVSDTAYSILGTDYLVAYATLTAARTATLPTAVGVAGQQYIVKDEVGAAGTDNITIATTSSQTIDGASTKVINTAYGVIRLYSNGANWFTW